MGRKLPEQAYEHYLELGVERSYQTVADHYGVSKAAVVNRAKRDDWQGRLRRIEREARERTERKAVDDMEAVRERQLKSARYLQARALEALRDLPPAQAGRVAQALNIAWKHELLLLGEPTDRHPPETERDTDESDPQAKEA